MIDKVFSLPEAFDLLVIDDASPDGTADIVRGRQAEFPGRLFLLERSGKLGLGTAYLTGFRWALAEGYDYVFEMDCDFSHNPDDLLRLYRAALGGADVVVGSRYIQGVNVVNWPMSRLLMSYCASSYVRTVTGRNGRIRLLFPRGAGSHRPRCGTDERLRFPDRDEIYGMASRFQYPGGFHHLHGPHGRGVEDEQRYLRRSVLGGDKAAFP